MEGSSEAPRRLSGVSFDDRMGLGRGDSETPGRGCLGLGKGGRDLGPSGLGPRHVTCVAAPGPKPEDAGFPLHLHRFIAPRSLGVRFRRPFSLSSAEPLLGEHDDHVPGRLQFLREHKPLT